MGRALLIMASGLIAIYSITILAMQKQGGSTERINAESAGVVQARNIAHAATDLALQKLESDKNWRTNGTPWQVSLDNGTAEVSVVDYSTKKVKITAVGNTNGESSQVVTIAKEGINSLIPKIYAALGIYLPNNVSYNGGGSYQIDGNDESGNVAPLPGVSVTSADIKNVITNDSPGSHITGEGGSPSIDVNSSMTFDEANALIAQLENQPGTVTITDSNYQGDLGTADNPGVFFIDSQVKITGNTTGYGIMVVRDNGALDLSGTLETAGTLDFHGLILFQDGWAFTGKGTSIIHGGMLLGGSQYYQSTTVDLRGTVDIKYNSNSLNYANMAIAQVLNKYLFTKVSVYE